MEDDDGMYELVEIIFRKKCTLQEKTVSHLSILSSLQTEDFSRKLPIVLYFKELVIIHRFKEYFDCKVIYNILCSHEEYLKYLLAICLIEYGENRDIYDSFIGVCALIKYANKDIFKKTGLNYLDLNSDIFMVFYCHVLRQSFLTGKGFSRFLVYIRFHKYIGWYSNRESFTDIGDHENIEFENTNKNIEEELSHRNCRQTSPKYMETIKLAASYMAQEVLSATSVELPVLPSELELIKRLVASMEKEAERNEAERKRHFESPMTKRTSSGNSSLNPDVKINYSEKRQEDIARHEDIIQAVIRYNHSNNASRENTTDQTSKDADRIIEDMKNKIESLTKVLDECDKE